MSDHPYSRTSGGAGDSLTDSSWLFENPAPSSRGGEGEGDPRVTKALEECLTALEAGQRIEDRQLESLYPEIADTLREHLEGLEFMHRTVVQMHDSSCVNVSPPRRQRGHGFLDAPAPALADYEILREVGRGGMGIVYEAVQRSLQRRVALKVLLASTLDPRHLQRFKNESQAAAQLQHPNIVPVFAVGSEQGVHYYAMRFIEGETLGQHIQRLQAGVPVDSQAADDDSQTIDAQATVQDRQFFQKAAWIGVQAAEALEHAHQMGVVHRDIKPGNLLLDNQDQLWVTDFGLARWSSDVAVTTTGDMLGTLRYMSPEQASAKRGLVDHRTDIYSLGATLYELVTLRPVFEGNGHGALLQQILNDDPLPPRRLCPKVPRDLETILLKSLAKQVEDRYATAQEMADDLRRFGDGRPVLARRPTLWERAGKWTRRHRPMVAAAALLLVLGVLGLAVGTVIIGHERAKAQAAYEHEVESRRTEAQARRVATAARARAEQNFRQARQLVDYLAELAAVDMAAESDVRHIRHKVLQAALSYYQDLIKQEDGNRLTREELLRGYTRVATILDAIGRPQDAQAAWDNVFKIGLDDKAGKGTVRLTPVQSKLRLLRLGCVQRDLKLSTQQVAAVLELEAKRKEWADRQGARPQGERYERADAIDRDAVKLLNPAQVSRLGQLLLRQRGIWAFQDPLVCASLDLTTAQREELSGIHKQAQACRSPCGVSDPGKKSPMERIVALFTPEQQSRWRKLIGKPFAGVLPPGDLVLSMGGTFTIRFVPAGAPHGKER